MERFNAVVIGASYSGLGIASIGKKILLLEEGEMLGSDYHLSFRPILENAIFKNAKTKELYDFFDANGIISESGADLLTMSTAICKFAVNLGLHEKIILNARLMECLPFEDGYKVTYFTNTGIHTVFAKDVIDTSFLRNTARNLIVIKEKYLHVVCTHLTDDAVKKLKDAGLVLTKGFLPNEYFISFKFNADTSLSDARLYIENTWQNLFKNGEFLIDTIGFNFDIQGTEKDGDAPLWIAPHSFENPISAFDAGCSLAEKKGW